MSCGCDKVCVKGTVNIAAETPLDVNVTNNPINALIQNDTSQRVPVVVLNDGSERMPIVIQNLLSEPVPMTIVAEALPLPVEQATHTRNAHSAVVQNGNWTSPANVRSLRAFVYRVTDGCRIVTLDSVVLEFFNSVPAGHTFEWTAGGENDVFPAGAFFVESDSGADTIYVTYVTA